LNTVQLNGDSYTIDIYTSIADIENIWSEYSGSLNYTKTKYLKLLENAGPLGYNYYYAVVKYEGAPYALYYFQRKKIALSKDFRIHTHKKDFWNKSRVGFLKTAFKFINNNILICGNVLLTGEYGFRSTTEKTLVTGLTDTVVKDVTRFIKDKEGIKIQTVLFKDFYQDKSWTKSKFDAEGFTEIVVQPDMVITFRDEWQSFEDYLSSVKSKYRVKFKKVLKKATNLEFRELNLAEAESYNDEMYALYKATADRALFSLFTLHPNYFKDLKATFKDEIVLTAVFLDNKLVGFYTFIENGTMGDAHFLGYDVSLNSKHQLYFNILLRLLDTGIKRGVSHLNLSRTALEIKSSVGAEPLEMAVYLRHENKMLNKLLPFLLGKTVPKNEWVQRKPFK